MSNVIQFLESLGSNAAMTRLSAAEYAATVASLEIQAGQRRALLDRDVDSLSALLGGRETMRCVIFQPGEDSERKGDDQLAGWSDRSETGRAS